MSVCNHMYNFLLVMLRLASYTEMTPRMNPAVIQIQVQISLLSFSQYITDALLNKIRITEKQIKIGGQVIAVTEPYCAARQSVIAFA